jgi:type II secretory ATPase GspE/PulE/Tfp pilus assembly ATPase PilB-like protein
MGTKINYSIKSILLLFFLSTSLVAWGQPKAKNINNKVDDFLSDITQKLEEKNQAEIAKNKSIKNKVEQVVEQPKVQVKPSSKLKIIATSDYIKINGQLPCTLHKLEAFLKLVLIKELCEMYNRKTISNEELKLAVVQNNNEVEISCAFLIPHEVLKSQLLDFIDKSFEAKAAQEAKAKEEAAKPKSNKEDNTLFIFDIKLGHQISLIGLSILVIWCFSFIWALKYIKDNFNEPFVKKYFIYLNYFALILGPVIFIVIICFSNKLFNKFFNKVSNAMDENTSIALLDNRGKELFTEDNSNESLKIVKTIFSTALTLHSSDIFIDPKPDSYCSVRLRVDGALREIMDLEDSVGESVINILKVAGGMDISERRRPQDGSFGVNTPIGNISIRAATVGTFSGEKIALRILGSDNGPKNLKDAGVSPRYLSILERTVKIPSGMILICGPTGSGKTTTLYSLLNSIDYSIKNVISIEDPIERVVPAISQMEVNTKAGITFAQLLRNALRQNPDVICLGEIRDEDTAQVAVHAAQTGHLIIATVHSNSNLGTIDRLMNLGIPLRSIAGTLRVIVSQRLVRKLCTCKKATTLPHHMQETFNSLGLRPKEIYAPGGCEKCGNTGYLGRVALFDILLVDDKLRNLLETNGATISQIENEYASIFKVNSMAADGYRLVSSGVTSLEEVERVTFDIS